MEELLSEFPCRENQIKLLNSILGEHDEPVPESIFLHGPPAVGKSSILLHYLKFTNAKYAFINCIECYTHRLLFETLLKDLLDECYQDKCDNFMDFIQRLKKASLQGDFSKEKCVIVLDGCENLVELGDYYLDAFCSLQNLTSIFSLTVIFVSHILLEKFNTSSSFITIHFPQYSKDELLQILLKDKPSGVSDEFYRNYLNAALSVFLRATRDLNEMKHLVVSNFEKYCEPLIKDEVKATDVNILWRHIVPHLKASLKVVYLGTGRIDERITSEKDKKDDLVTNHALYVFDLPYYAKYFLIAAYLASYNSPKHDKRLFLKHHGKQKKKIPRKNVKEKITAELLGPKAFSLDRLLAIFYSIMEEKTSLTANLMAQISSLVELKLLTRLGDGTLDKPKYKCFVGLQCVDTVARTLGFNIKKYLMD